VEPDISILRKTGHFYFALTRLDATLLYVMQADGANARIVADSLDLKGSPAWSPDGQSITTAADILLIPRGRPMATSLSTRDPTSARHFR
jgi:Tol biopolymer transport system component